MLFNQLNKIQQDAADQFLAEQLDQSANHFITKKDAESYADGKYPDDEYAKHITRTKAKVYYVVIGDTVRAGCDEDFIVDYAGEQVDQNAVLQLVWSQIKSFTLEYYEVN